MEISNRALLQYVKIQELPDITADGRYKIREALLFSNPENCETLAKLKLLNMQTAYPNWYAAKEGVFQIAPDCWYAYRQQCKYC